MKFAITFGQKYNDPEIKHNTLGEEVTGYSYMVVYANDEMAARQALAEALLVPGGYYGDYAFIYEWEEFEPGIEEYWLTPLSKHLFVGAVGDWRFVEEGADNVSTN